MVVIFQPNSLREEQSLKPKIFFSSQDPYSRYGLRHFLKKYNFARARSIQQADIYIGCSASENTASKGQILLNSTAEDGPGLLHYENTMVPIFKQPVKTFGGTSLALAEDRDGLYPCLTISGNLITIGFDIFAEIGRFLAGCYDEHFVGNDKTGKTLKAVPVVDVLEDCLFSAIKKIIPGLCTHQQFAWPDNYKFAMVLTHDVDQVYKTHQYLTSLFNSSMKADLRRLSYHIGNMLFKHGKNNPFWTFDNICSLEQSLGVRSTYYFLQESGRVNPFSLKSWILYHGRYNIGNPVVKEIIRRLDESGYEIGVHGSYRSYKDSALIRMEKELIQSIVKSEIAGIRQHHLNYDSNITPTLHLSCGFKYDTSIGFKPKQGIGFRRGTSFPFPIMTPEGKVLPLIELPLIIMDAAIGRTATAGECFNLMHQVEKYRGVLTILWHQTTLNKREFPSQAGLYETLIREALKRGAWIATAREVYEWVTAGGLTEVKHPDKT